MTLVELKAIMAKASPGPWKWEKCRPNGIIFKANDEVIADGVADEIDITGNDATAIVAAVNAVPVLVRVIEGMADGLAKAGCGTCYLDDMCLWDDESDLKCRGYIIKHYISKAQKEE